jgi:hypothetical protein
MKLQLMDCPSSKPPTGGAFWRADAVAGDQLQAIEVEVVSVGPNRAAGLDPRPLEGNSIPLKQIGRHAQPVGTDHLARWGIGILLRGSRSGRRRA